MFFELWHNFLYQPLLNILIFIYNGAASQNLGVAVIFLTLALRFLLLPFSIISLRSKGFYEKLAKYIESIRLAFKNDPVLQKQEIREFLRKNKVNPWAKAIVFGVQAVVLVVLYQVFLGGIRLSKFNDLYSWVGQPDFVNTRFLGFDLGARSLLWPAIVAGFLFFEIILEQRKKHAFLMNQDIVYRYFFPLIIFIVLAILPMVKSLFILTSLLFSFIVLRGIMLLTPHPSPHSSDER